MKQYKNKIIAFCVATGMCAGMYAGYIPKNASASVADDGTDTYIVQMEDSETLGEISEKYNEQISGGSESYDSLENENCVVLDLTKSQAASLSDAEGVDFLESDLEMQGTASKMSSVSECGTEWNIDMVNADIEENTAEINDKDNLVKVAIIDSGIDYTNGINVVKRKNFIPYEDDISILYEDASGHGTSVAGVIAASGEENKDLTGIAKNAEIYSAKVLDSCNKAPISRVVEGIYWAIEQGVDIINLSLGTSKPSELLEKAVKDAYDKGILLIASAGNNEKAGVEYPAAYDEVMAVASVDSHGEHSIRSAVGDKVEIAAPGEKVKTASCFDGEIVVSGTSIATPHITAIAAKLWEKDRTKSAQFIRGLVDASANDVGDKSEYGYGIADLSYAIEIYDEYEKNYVESTGDSAEETLENIEDAAEMTENNASIEVYENDYVTGRWGTADHAILAEIGSISGNDLKVLKWGASVSDYIFGLSQMARHPYLHGFGYGIDAFSPNKSEKIETNYIASYILLTKMAEVFEKNNSYSDPATVVGLSSRAYKEMCDSINANSVSGRELIWDDRVKEEHEEYLSYTWGEILTENRNGNIGNKFKVNKHNKALILYGMALHTASDTFAHSAYVDGERLRHPTEDEKKQYGDLYSADRTGYYPNRYNCAKIVAKKLLTHASNRERGKVADWVISSDIYKNKFKLVGFSKFAKSVNIDVYNANKNNFDNMNLNVGNIIKY